MPDLRTGTTGPLGLVEVIVVALAVSLVGWLGAAVLDKVTKRARGVWRVFAVLLLLGSLYPVVTAERLPASSRGGLLALHLVVALTLLVLMGPTLRSPERDAA